MDADSENREESQQLKGGDTHIDATDRIKLASTAIADMESEMRISIEADEDKKVICGRLVVVLFMMTFFSISLSKFDSDAMKKYELRIANIEKNVTSMLSLMNNSTKLIDGIKDKTIPDLLKIEYRSKCKTFLKSDFNTTDTLLFELRPYFSSEFPDFNLLDVPFYSISSMNLTNPRQTPSGDYEVFASRVDKSSSTKGPVFEFLTKLMPDSIVACFMADGNRK